MKNSIGIVRLVTKEVHTANYYTGQVDNINKLNLQPATKEEFEAQLAKENLKFNYETLTTEPLQKYPNGTWVKWTGVYPTLGRVVRLHPHDGRENYVLEHTNDPERKYDSCFIKYLEAVEISEVIEHLKTINKTLDANGEVIPLDEFAHLPQKIEDVHIKSVEKRRPQYEYLATVYNKYDKALYAQRALLELYEAWKDEESNYVIYLSQYQGLSKGLLISDMVYGLFGFATREKAERFLNQFRDLLEQYKPLMGGQ